MAGGNLTACGPLTPKTVPLWAEGRDHPRLQPADRRRRPGRHQQPAHRPLISGSGSLLPVSGVFRFRWLSRRATRHSPPEPARMLPVIYLEQSEACLAP
jgi:hypothetical protein